MRHLTKALLTAGLVAAFVSVALAQRQPGRGGMGGPQITDSVLLNSKDVQSELKLTDAQKESLKKIADKLAEDTKAAFTDKKFDEVKTIRETADKATAEIVKDLKPEQTKRLKQISLQETLKSPRGALTVFTKEEVQKELGLEDKQKDAIKSIVEDTNKDTAEIMKGVGRGGDADKRKEATEKVATLNKEAVEKITTKTFTEEQQKKWKVMLGEKFDGKIDFPMMGGPGRGGKDKKKDS
jgi:Spy/CpxP family protein refolding chaperone